MRSISMKSKVVIAGVAAGTLALSGVAYAYWSTTGSGSGNSTSTASAGTVAFQVTFDAGTLAPGTSVPVTYAATNSTPSDLSVATPTAAITSDKKYDATHSCADYLSLTGSTLHGGVVPHGGASTAMGGATLEFANDALVNQDGCIGQKVTITLTAS